MRRQKRERPGAGNAEALNKEGASLSSAGERDLSRPGLESKEERPPRVQAGERWFLHVVDNEFQTELYFPEQPPGLPGRYIRIDCVGDGWMDEEAHSFRFYKRQRPDLADLLGEFADDDLLIAVPYGAGWVEVAETMGGRTGDGSGVMWKRRRRMARS